MQLRPYQFYRHFNANQLQSLFSFDWNSGSCILIRQSSFKHFHVLWKKPCMHRSSMENFLTRDWFIKSSVFIQLRSLAHWCSNCITIWINDYDVTWGNVLPWLAANCSPPVVTYDPHKSHRWTTKVASTVLAMSTGCHRKFHRCPPMAPMVINQ